MNRTMLQIRIAGYPYLPSVPVAQYDGWSLETSRNPTQPKRLVRLRIIGALWNDNHPRLCIEIGDQVGIKDIEAVWQDVVAIRDELISCYGPEPNLSQDIRNLITEALIGRCNRGESYSQLAQWVSGCIEDCLRVSIMIPNGDTEGYIYGPPGLSNWGNGWFGFMTAMELTRWFGIRQTEDDRNAYLQRARENIKAGRPVWGENAKDSPVDMLTIRERLRQQRNNTVE